MTTLLTILSYNTLLIIATLKSATFIHTNHNLVNPHTAYKMTFDNISISVRYTMP